MTRSNKLWKWKLQCKWIDIRPYHRTWEYTAEEWTVSLNGKGYKNYVHVKCDNFICNSLGKCELYNYDCFNSENENMIYK